MPPRTTRDSVMDRRRSWPTSENPVRPEHPSLRAVILASGSVMMMVATRWLHQRGLCAGFNREGSRARSGRHPAAGHPARHRTATRTVHCRRRCLCRLARDCCESVESEPERRDGAEQVWFEPFHVDIAQICGRPPPHRGELSRVWQQRLVHAAGHANQRLTSV